MEAIGLYTSVTSVIFSQFSCPSYSPYSFSTVKYFQYSEKVFAGIELEEGRLRILEQISGEKLIRSLEIEF